MYFLLRVTPALLLRCAGVFVCMAMIACEKSPFKRETSLDIGSDTIKLEQGVDLHEILVKSEQGKDFEPATIEAKTGDVVRFKTGDARTHVLSFDPASIPPAANQLFGGANQMRSPPLLMSGVTWIVSFKDAPAGTYRYRCETHEHSGQILVK